MLLAQGPCQFHGQAGMAHLLNPILQAARIWVLQRVVAARPPVAVICLRDPQRVTSKASAGIGSRPWHCQQRLRVGRHQLEGHWLACTCHGRAIACAAEVWTCFQHGSMSCARYCTTCNTCAGNEGASLENSGVEGYLWKQNAT